MSQTRLAFLGLVGVAALALAGAAPANAPAGDAAFSRGRWIDAQRGWARFDGGLEPGTRRSRAAVRGDAALLPERRPRPVPEGPPNVRISDDVLEADPDSPAQPETEAEPSLAADPNDEAHLVVGYQEDRFEDGGARALTAAVSFDAGKTWRETLVPALARTTGGAFERASDPWVAFGPDGRVYYAALVFDESRPDNAITVSVSEDGGVTYGPPATVHVNRSRDFDDKEAVVVDLADGSPFYGRVYVAWDTVSADQRHQTLRLAHSDDGGATWSAPRAVWDNGANLGAIPLVGPGGALHLVWMSYFADRVEIRAARSDDGGESFAAPALVALADSRGVDGLRTGGLVAAAIDPRGGRLYAVWPDQRFTRGTDQIVLAISNDGVGWTAPQRVSDGPDDAPSFTPAVAVNGQGRYGIAYSTLRNDPARRFLVDQYFVTTNSRGRPLAATRSSTRSFDVRSAAIARGYFLGDYQGLVAGRRTFRPVWVSTDLEARRREGRQPDIVTLHLP